MKPIQTQAQDKYKKVSLELNALTIELKSIRDKIFNLIKENRTYGKNNTINR